MSRKYRKYFIVLWLIAANPFTSASAQETKKSKPEPLVIPEQGSLAVGGTVVTALGAFDPIKQGAYNPAGTDPTGQTLRGDHAYVFYLVPVNARKIPLVFWHGHGQSAKTWETTPDGREWFQNIFMHLPEIGIRGNTHFPKSDMNNLKIADLLSKFLKERRLD